MLLLENHLNTAFGWRHQVEKFDVQAFVFRKLDDGLSHK